MAAARAAYVAGFATSSNLAARHRYGVPTAGTSAHSFTLLHDTEADAFRAQVESLGRGTTLLVDTYDIAEAVRLGVEVAGPELGAVRIDSGDLGVLAREVRGQLDELGATGHPDRGDQRPRRVRDRGAGRRAGRRVRRRHRAGHRQRPPDLRLRLQARGARGRRPASWSSVAKKSQRQDLASAAASTRCAGRSADGVAEAEVVGIGEPPVDDGDDRPLLVDAGARRRGGRPREPRRRPRPAHRRPRRAPARGAADVAGRAGHRDPARRRPDMALRGPATSSPSPSRSARRSPSCCPRRPRPRSASTRRRGRARRCRSSTCCTASPTTTPPGCATPRSSGTRRRRAWPS